MKTLPAHVLRWAAFLAAATFAPAVLLAQSDMGSSSSPDTTTAPAAGTSAPSSGTLAHRDRSFFEKAAQGGMKEVAVSQAVMPHLTNAPVRDFAKMMISDHTSANAALASLAGSKGVELPSLDPTIAAKWSGKADGADKDYIDEMVEDHEGVVKLFEKAGTSSDPDIAAFAQKMLPTLQHHLAVARQLKATL